MCPVVNTGVFLLGCQFFFLPTIREWAAMYGYADAGTYMIFGLAGFNFLIELQEGKYISAGLVYKVNLLGGNRWKSKLFDY